MWVFRWAINACLVWQRFSHSGQTNKSRVIVGQFLEMNTFPESFETISAGPKYLWSVVCDVGPKDLRIVDWDVGASIASLLEFCEIAVAPLVGTWDGGTSAFFPWLRASVVWSWARREFSSLYRRTKERFMSSYSAAPMTSSLRNSANWRISCNVDEVIDWWTYVCPDVLGERALVAQWLRNCGTIHYFRYKRSVKTPKP